jgi:hypothetical protein
MGSLDFAQPFIGAEIWISRYSNGIFYYKRDWSQYLPPVSIRGDGIPNFSRKPPADRKTAAACSDRLFICGIDFIYLVAPSRLNCGDFSYVHMVAYKNRKTESVFLVDRFFIQKVMIPDPYENRAAFGKGFPSMSELFNFGCIRHSLFNMICQTYG